jgi:diguanylate cyclase (GGDEF)-like protein/PAS domain S-box-containing protein
MEELVTKEEAYWLRQLLTNPHIGILVTDINRKIIFVNEHLCEGIGYTKEELLGNDSRIFHVSDKLYDAFFQQVIQKVQDGEPFSIDYEARHKNGNTVWITISGNLLESKTEVLWTIVDITDRVEKEQEIKKLKERMEIALAGYNAGVWEWNITTGDIYISHEWKKMMGLSCDTPSHIDTWKERVHPDDLEDVFLYIENALAKKETKLEHIHRVRHNSGEWIWILARATVIYEESGEIRLVGIHTDITSQKNIETELFHQKQQLHHLAHHDALTNLPNRLMFHEQLDLSLQWAKANKKRGAVLFIDLDYFKEINDNYGHDVGDIVLQIIAKRFLDKVRMEDTLARLGGDEFAVVMHDISSKEDSAILAEKFLEIFSDPIVINGNAFHLSCSIGIATYLDDTSERKSLLKYADMAMYKAKEQGRNCYVFYK